MADLEKGESVPSDTINTDAIREPAPEPLEKTESLADSESTVDQMTPSTQPDLSRQKSTSSPLARFASNISQAASSVLRPKDGIAKETYPEQNLDKDIVGWEGQDDPENPRYVQPIPGKPLGAHQV